MRRPLLLALCSLVVLGAAAPALRGLKHPAKTHGTSRSAPESSDRATPLAFGELLAPGAVLRPSDKALALNGKRVRIVGFMAEMEEPLAGAFYLVPRPLKLDESGAGTGDLPLESILVDVPGPVGRAIAHVEGALAGTGVLEVGNRADVQGRVANFRLRLDPDQRLAQPRAALAASSEQ